MTGVFPGDRAVGQRAERDPGPIKVLIVDDHPLIREGLQAMLAREADIVVIGVAGDAEQAVEVAVAHEPEVVLMDFRLAGRTGAEAALEIRGAKPGTAIVFLSSEQSEGTLSEAVHAGAAGYLLKTAPAEEVVNAIRSAAAGEMLFPARVLAELLGRERSRARAAADLSQLASSLTEREHEVLGLTARGMDNAGIAAELFVSLTTVRWHVRNILEKLGVHSRLAAVARAAEIGLLVRPLAGPLPDEG